LIDSEDGSDSFVGKSGADEFSLSLSTRKFAKLFVLASLDGRKLFKSFKLGECRGSFGRVGGKSPKCDDEADVGRMLFELELKVDAKGSEGSCGLWLNEADEAEGGGDAINMDEYTLLVFVFEGN
jgi:hypothetical protein